MHPTSNLHATLIHPSFAFQAPLKYPSCTLKHPSSTPHTPLWHHPCTIHAPSGIMHKHACFWHPSGIPFAPVKQPLCTPYKQPHPLFVCSSCTPYQVTFSLHWVKTLAAQYPQDDTPDPGHEACWVAHQPEAKLTTKATGRWGPQLLTQAHHGSHHN